MLFWCFFYTWVVEKLNVRKRFKIAIVCFCSLFIILPNYLRMSQAFYYLPFFYLGYVVWEKKDRISPLFNIRNLFILWTLFALLFVTMFYIRDNYLQYIHDVSSTLYRYFDMVCKYSYSIVGTIAFYATAVVITKKYQVGSKIMKVGGLCFGVYIWQQFILKLLLYKSNFALAVNIYLLPWVIMIIALVLSLFLAKVCKDL